jgi:hypothetical protein
MNISDVMKTFKSKPAKELVETDQERDKRIQEQQAANPFNAGAGADTIKNYKDKQKKMLDEMDK